MGKLNGPGGALVWIGDSNGCNEVDIYNLRENVDIIYTANQSGSYYTVQQVNSANSPFAILKKLNCGVAAALLTKKDFILNGVGVSGNSNKRIILNYATEISVSGLTGDYSEGNGKYIITTFFYKNNPTYKNKSGWVIKKENVYWQITSNIENLSNLENASISPDGGNFLQLNCSSNNCQTAIVNTDTSDDDSVDVTNDEIPALQNLHIKNITDNSIEITWSQLQDIDGYEIELSNSISFLEKTKFNLNAYSTSFEFNNLTDSLVYFFRIRFINYKNSGEHGEFSVRQVVTSMSGKKSNLNIGMTNDFFPILKWELVKNITYDYIIKLHRSRDKQTWNDIKTFSSKDNIKEYIDNDITDKGIYYYSLSFDNGVEGSHSEIVQANVDKTKPKLPNIKKVENPTSSKYLKFDWTEEYSDNKKIYYLYKLNSSQWIKYTDTQIKIPVTDGNYTFRLKSVDQFNNMSEEAIRVVRVDQTPPKKPILTLDSQNINTKTTNVSWKYDADVSHYLYKFNKKTWVKLDKTITSIKLNVNQGLNSLEIKSIDSVGNESELVEVNINADFIPPAMPKIDKSKIPTLTKLNKLLVKWDVDDDVNGFKYRTTTWKTNTSKVSTNWVTLGKNARSVTNTLSDGYFQFEIYAFDEYNNKSDINSIVLLVDRTPPETPKIDEVETYINKISELPHTRFKVIIDDSSSEAFYSLNNSGWISFPVSTTELDLEMKQGENILKCYTKDKAENISSEVRFSKLIDTIDPEPPIFIAPLGSVPRNLVSELWRLCQLNHTYDTTQNIKITYSYIKKNTPVGFDGGVHGESRYNSSNIVELKSDLLSNFEFKKQIEKAFSDFKEVIQDAFPKVIVNFVNLGDEEHTNIPAGSRYGYTDTDKELLKIGDIRIGMCDVNSPTEIVNDSSDINFSNCMLFDTKISWLKDTASESLWNEKSCGVRYATRHYIGRLLGLPINKENNHGTQHELELGKKVNLTNRSSSDVNLFYNTYSFPRIGGVDVKVFDNFPVEVVWKNNTPFTYEYRTSIIIDGRIKEGSPWKVVSQTESTQNKVILTKHVYGIYASDVLWGRINALVRIYVRSVDAVGNKSESSYIDLKLSKHFHEHELNRNNSIIDASQYCETNIDMKNNYNCWDKYGLYNVQLQLNKQTWNESGYYLVEIREGSSKFSRYERRENNTEKLTIDSLKPNTIYNFRVLRVSNGFDSSTTSLLKDYLIGDVFGDFTDPVSIKTEKSYLEKPSAVQLTSVTHFRYKNIKNPTYKYPTGEVFSSSRWSPCANINWTETDSKFFSNYTIVYYEKGKSIASANKIKVTDKSQTKITLEFNKYDTEYLIYIDVHDSLGNFKKSSNELLYKTVPLDDAPVLVGRPTIEYTGDLSVRYNERPNSKWTLKIKFPIIRDSQYPSKNKFKDVVDFEKKTLSKTDWIALIGHLPLKLTYGGSGTEQKIFWITHEGVYNEQNEKQDFNLAFADEKINLTIPGFNADSSYGFKITAFDKTGHFTEGYARIKTKRKPDSSNLVPDQPTIEVKRHRYLNGTDFSGNSLESYQWLLNVETIIPTDKNIKYFYVWYKTKNAISYVNKVQFDLSKFNSQLVVKTPGKIIYKCIVQGFKPKTSYSFKVDSVSDSGQLSKSSEEVSITTPVGDQIKPEKVRVLRFKIVNGTSGVKPKIEVTIHRPTYLGSSLVLLHTPNKNANSSDMWTFNKNLISSGSISSFSRHSRYITFSIPFDSLANGAYMCLMYRDTAYNLSAKTELRIDPLTGMERLLSPDEENLLNLSESQQVLLLT